MTAAALWGLSMSLPETFQELDLELDAASGVMVAGAAVDEHLARLGGEVDPAVRAGLVERAVALFEHAHRSEAIAAALALDAAEDAPPLQAYVLVHCVAGSDGVDPVALDELAETLGQASAFDVGPRVSEVVELGDHLAVRSVGLLEVDPGAASSPLVAAQQYWIPVADTGTLALISCWTPQLHLLDELGGVFDAIADSVRFS